MESKASTLASLCWINPFSRHRQELEEQLLNGGQGSRDRFQWSTKALLDLCEEVIREEPDGKEYAEIVSFTIYHRLAQDLDQLVANPAEASRVWAKHSRLWNTYYKRRKNLPAFDAQTQFALFYQIRRAFHWIYRYVIGSSEEAIKLRYRIWESIFSADLNRYVNGFHREMNDVHTLITGPSGSGKGVVARAIGMARYIPFDPASRTFVTDPETSFLTVNVAALPDQLLEAELFGHSKGAFTGASRARSGFFESAGEHGALFLDEIGEAGASAQAKLLTVLQDRQFQRVGETRSRQAQGRVIAATNLDLEKAVASGAFREDLYFRLSADRLEMVTLKDLIGGRIEALRPMVDHITRKLMRESWSPAVVGDSLQFIEDRLGKDYPWPGNFRELEQCLRNVLIHQDYKPIRITDSPDKTLDDVLGEVDLDAEGLLRRYAKTLYRRLGTYKKVGEMMGLDQRTAKKYVD
jgi:transcriptional regulator of acetoin/glycerol metabolism